MQLEAQNVATSLSILILHQLFQRLYSSSCSCWVFGHNVLALFFFFFFGTKCPIDLSVERFLTTEDLWT